MGRGPELSVQMRSRICELRSLRWGAKRIHRQHPEIPLSTIKYTLKKEAERKDNASLPRSGAPSKLSQADKDHILHRVQTEPKVTHKDLLVDIDYKVKERALRGFLYANNLRKWLQLRRQQLTPAQAEARRQWAERYRDLDWRRVKWSDECMVRRGQGATREWSFLRPKEQLEQHDVHEVQRQGSVRQMFWAAFGYQQRTGLIALEGNVDSQGIYDLYSAFLPDLLHPGDIFMHDNASVHTARIVKALLEEMDIEVMIWPPYSPDLNPIENLWALMKREIYRLYPDLRTAPDVAETAQCLREAAKEAWHNIRQEVHESLCDSMGNRIEAIVKADGWYTKY